MQSFRANDVLIFLGGCSDLRAEVLQIITRLQLQHEAIVSTNLQSTNFVLDHSGELACFSTQAPGLKGPTFQTRFVCDLDHTPLLLNLESDSNSRMPIQRVQ